jgi:hypothetical protein
LALVVRAGQPQDHHHQEVVAILFLETLLQPVAVAGLGIKFLPAGQEALAEGVERLILLVVSKGTEWVWAVKASLEELAG